MHSMARIRSAQRALLQDSKQSCLDGDNLGRKCGPAGSTGRKALLDLLILRLPNRFAGHPSEEEVGVLGGLSAPQIQQTGLS